MLIKLKYVRWLIVSLMMSTVELAYAEFEETTSSKLIQQDCLFSGRFIQQETRKDLDTSIVSSGSIFFDCKQGIIWKTEKEHLSLKILTVDNIHYHLDENDNLKPLESIPDSLQAKLLLSLLSGDDSFIEKHFVIDADQLNLSLRPKTKTYQRGLQSIAINKKAVSSSNLDIKIVDRNGQSITMMISQNQTYDKAQDGYDICEALYPKTEYCRILKNPLHYQTIND